jgi:hypothetical protein
VEVANSLLGKAAGIVDRGRNPMISAFRINSPDPAKK